MFFTGLSKNFANLLAMSEQDVITPLAPGETPGGFERNRKA
jgi:hypothetical protein